MLAITLHSNRLTHAIRIVLGWPHRARPSIQFYGNNNIQIAALRGKKYFHIRRCARPKSNVDFVIGSDVKMPTHWVHALKAMEPAISSDVLIKIVRDSNLYFHQIYCVRHLMSPTCAWEVALAMGAIVLWCISFDKMCSSQWDVVYLIVNLSK